MCCCSLYPTRRIICSSVFHLEPSLIIPVFTAVKILRNEMHVVYERFRFGRLAACRAGILGMDREGNADRIDLMLKKLDHECGHFGMQKYTHNVVSHSSLAGSFLRFDTFHS